MGGRPCSCQMGLLVTVPYRWMSWMGLGSCTEKDTPVLRAQGARGEGHKAAEGNLGKLELTWLFPEDCYAYPKPHRLPRPNKVSQYEKSQTSFNLDFIFQAWIDRHQENSSMGANMNGQLPGDANPRGTLTWPSHGIWPPSLSSLRLR